MLNHPDHLVSVVAQRQAALRSEAEREALAQTAPRRRSIVLRLLIAARERSIDRAIGAARRLTNGRRDRHGFPIGLAEEKES